MQIKRLLLRKALMIVPTVLALSFFSFMVIYLAPGDVGTLLLEEKNKRGFVTDAQSKSYKQAIGLDKPFTELYWQWLRSLLRGDLGHSYLTNEPVTDTFMKKFSVTFKLANLTVIIYLILGLPAGIFAALRNNRIHRALLKNWRIISMSIPNFWIALILVWAIANYFPSLHSIGYYGVKSLIIPSLLLGFMSFSNLTSIIQSKTKSVLAEQYIIYATALGVKKKYILGKHILKSVVAPAVAVACLDYTGFIGGAILIENIFSIPGLGVLLADAIRVKDYFMIAGALFLLGLFINIINLIADSIYILVDRRGTNE